MTASTVPAVVLASRPRYEGANIRTWIGFKHFYYLVEEAVLEWLREQGTGARQLFHEYGLGLEILECSVLLPAVLEVDDPVRVEVSGPGPKLSVRILVDRDDTEVVALRGTVRVALVRERTAPAHAPAPGGLSTLELPDVPHTGTDVDLPAGASVAEVLTPRGSGAFLWSWRIPYFYCHFTDRLQQSGYVRALEEVVDRFLDARGISVGKLLQERTWIPVVSRVKVTMLSAAHMEETVHTVFRVDDILRDVMFTGTMDNYVRRGDRLVHTATASILHGYAISAGPDAGQLATLDGPVRAALLGDAA